MANDNTYRQCRLVRKTETGTTVQVSWIPSVFAKVGKKLSLRRDRSGGGCIVEFTPWESGWVVEAVYGLQTRQHLDAQRAAQKRWEGVLEDH